MRAYEKSRALAGLVSAPAHSAHASALPATFLLSSRYRQPHAYASMHSIARCVAFPQQGAVSSVVTSSSTFSRKHRQYECRCQCHSLILPLTPTHSVAFMHTRAHPSLSAAQPNLDARHARTALSQHGKNAAQHPTLTASQSSPTSSRRINLIKLIARAGVCSRRAALELIESGRVTVDGHQLTTGDSYWITPEQRVTIDGKPFLDPYATEDGQEKTNTVAQHSSSHVQSSPDATQQHDPHSAAPSPSASPLIIPTRMPTPKLWLYYKPVGLLVSHKDERLKRETIYDQIKRDHFSNSTALASMTPRPSQIKSATSSSPRSTFHSTSVQVDRLLSVGRLDYLSSGLLLLTNSGSWQRFLEHPSSGFERVYHIKTDRPLSEEQRMRIEAGLDMDGFKFKPCRVRIINDGKKQNEVESDQADEFSVKKENAADVENLPDQQLQPSIPRRPRAAWYEVTLYEGKNRELRTLMNYFNLRILQLERVAFHHWAIGVWDRNRRRRKRSRTARGSSMDDMHDADDDDDGVDAAQHRPDHTQGRTEYRLQPGELVELEWTTQLERQRREWLKRFQAKQR